MYRKRIISKQRKEILMKMKLLHSVLCIGMAISMSTAWGASRTVKHNTLPTYYDGKTYAAIKKAYIADNAWGLCTCIDVYNCNPELIRSAQAIEEYIIQLCTLIDMKQYGDPQIRCFGSGNLEGYSMYQFIETSHISGHFTEDTNTVHIEIFSCKIYDPYIVLKFTKEFFKGNDYEIRIFPRI